MFGLPIAVVVAIVTYLWRANRSELGHISAYTAILMAFASPTVGLWGEARLHVLSNLTSLDYGFELGALLVSIVATLLALTLFIRSRRWYSFAVFAISSLMSALWVLIYATF